MGLAQLAQGGGLPNLWHGILFFIGAVVMRGAGCVVNDLADQDLDAKVERTKNRPLPSGRVSRQQAFVLLAALLLIGLVVLLQFNRLTIITAIASLGIVTVYPFMKRITYVPQLVLGMAFNWGAIVGFTAEMNAFAPASFMLYLAGISWTMAYDTIYAHQDKEDDMLIGVKSTALLFGKSTRSWLAFFFALSIVLLSFALWLAHAPLIAHIGSVAAGLQAIWQLRTFDDANSSRCLQLFRSNRNFGLLVVVGMLIGCLLK